MKELTDLEERLKRRDEHTFCKEVLAKRRKKDKCPQNKISSIKEPSGNSWHIYIDPEGLVGCFSGCCRWEAMIKALDDKFCEEE